MIGLTIDQDRDLTTEEMMAMFSVSERRDHQDWRLYALLRPAWPRPAWESD